MARDGLCPGVLSTGAKHVSTESPAGRLKDGQPLKWEQMWIETRLSAEELAQRGIRAGTRVVIAGKHKTLWRLGDCVCGYNLDCRAGLAAMLEVGLHLRENRPAQDVYLVASSSEEIGGHGAIYALGRLPVDAAVAVDIAPAAAEYGTTNSGDPIIGVRDSRGLYDARIIERFDALAAACGFGIQTAVLTSYASDSSIAKTSGAIARAALIGYPGDNTHGYEICAWDGIVNAARCFWLIRKIQWWTKTRAGLESPAFLPAYRARGWPEVSLGAPSSLRPFADTRPRRSGRIRSARPGR